jgi:hypothetical protein
MVEVTREEPAAMTGQELLAYERETSANPHLFPQSAFSLYVWCHMRVTGPRELIHSE